MKLLEKRFMKPELPIEPKSTKTVTEALLEAERGHWLDCPYASLSLRVAAVLLDLIFIYLVSHGLDRLFESLGMHGPNLLPQSKALFSPFLLGFFQLFLKLSFFSLYLVWSVCFLGGTLGKLLLGLRVVNSDTGHFLSFSAAVLRFLLVLFTNIVSLAVVMTRPDRKGLHDLWCKSAVKKIRGMK
jgi:uncharacterized RDD family membrane protein YckC